MTNFIGHYFHDKERRDSEFSFGAVLDKTHLRYASKLHDVNWAYIVDQILPSLNHYRKSIIFHTSGQFSISPLLLLSKVIQDEKHGMKTDEEFRSSVKTFANDLSWHDQEFDSMNAKIESSSLEYSLRKLFDNDDGLINDYLAICDTISHKFDIFEKIGKKSPMVQHELFERDEDNEIELALPYSSKECWELGKSNLESLHVNVKSFIR